MSSTETGPTASAVIVIPARLESTRLPRKLLLNQTGKSLLQHTYEAACQSQLASRVIVAADDAKLVDCVNDFGGEVVLTSPDHQSGSSRVAEVAAELKGIDIVVNVQGDEPEIEGAAIDLAIAAIRQAETAVVSTLACPIQSREQLDDPSNVKVVMRHDGAALYFSRSPIPFARQWQDDLLTRTPNVFYQHIGLYAYRKDFLLQFSELPDSDLEQLESLEQLRILDAGYEIQVKVVEHYAAGIDTQADYEAFVSRFES